MEHAVRLREPEFDGVVVNLLDHDGIVAGAQPAGAAGVSSVFISTSLYQNMMSSAVKARRPTSACLRAG